MPARVALDERVSCTAYPSNPAGGHASDERVGGHVFDDYRTRCNSGPFTDRHGRHTRRTRADGCSTLDRDAHGFPVVCALLGTIGVDRARVGVIRQNDGRADKHPIAESRGLVDECIILHLAVVSHHDTRANIGSASDNAVLTENSLFTNLSQMPDRGPCADNGIDRDVSGLGDTHRGRVTHVRGSSRRRDRSSWRIDKPTALCQNRRMSTLGTAGVAVADEAAWVVIPLFNEATVIGEVVSGLRPRFSHIVCVDDGSTDGSAGAARSAGAIVVSHPVNLGQGAALQTGLDYVLERDGAEYVILFDADGQHRVEDALAMLAMARSRNLAIVFGSRFLDDRTKPGWMKHVILKTAVWVTNQTTGLRLTDAHNGLKVMRRDAATFVHLKQDRMAHATEIVLQLGDSGLPWAEHPVELLYTDYSKAKGQSVLNSVNILVDLVVR